MPTLLTQAVAAASLAVFLFAFRARFDALLDRRWWMAIVAVFAATVLFKNLALPLGEYRAGGHDSQYLDVVRPARTALAYRSPLYNALVRTVGVPFAAVSPGERLETRAARFPSVNDLFLLAWLTAAALICLRLGAGPWEFAAAAGAGLSGAASLFYGAAVLPHWPAAAVFCAALWFLYFELREAREPSALAVLYCACAVVAATYALFLGGLLLIPAALLLAHRRAGWRAWVGVAGAVAVCALEIDAVPRYFVGNFMFSTENLRFHAAPSAFAAWMWPVSSPGWLLVLTAAATGLRAYRRGAAALAGVAAAATLLPLAFGHVGERLFLPLTLGAVPALALGLRVLRERAPRPAFYAALGLLAATGFGGAVEAARTSFRPPKDLGAAAGLPALSEAGFLTAVRAASVRGRRAVIVRAAPTFPYQDRPEWAPHLGPTLRLPFPLRRLRPESRPLFLVLAPAAFARTTAMHWEYRSAMERLFELEGLGVLPEGLAVYRVRATR